MQTKQAPANHIGKTSPWEWLQDVDLNALEGQLNAAAGRGGGAAAGGGGGGVLGNRPGSPPRSRLHVWLIRLSTSVLLWTCFIQLIALAQLWQPRFLNLRAWPPCLDHRYPNPNPNRNSQALASTALSLSPSSSVQTTPAYRSPSSSISSSVDVPAFFDSTYVTVPHPFPRAYKNNGYLLISCNGGLNQMRAAICDMVAIAKLLNVTLVVPELDKTSFWADPSDFRDIFDVDHFILSLRDEVRIVKHVPTKYYEKLVTGAVMSMPPVSWSNESYYLNQILPLVKKHKVLRFSKTDTRLANSGLPLEMQKLRCRANYKALRFTPAIERLGQKLVEYLKAKGPFLVLHLRYEMDMLAFSGCTHGCTDEEADELTKMRYAYPWWKEKVIDSEQKRLEGLCPLTPEETALFLQAVGFGNSTQIYIAAGEIYGSERRMAPLYAAFPNIVRKEMLLSPYELRSFQNHSSQMAALDYLVAIESDVFVPTYDGNMAKVVEGHRRFMGYRKTITLDRKRLIKLVDHYQNNTMGWEEFSTTVREAHYDHVGAPRRRVIFPDRPKEEDYFYSNPEECLT